MKKRISAYLTILLAFFCYQTKAQNLAVESFELALTDLTANTPGTIGAYTLQIRNEGVLDSYAYVALSFALPVRCVKE